MKPVKKIEIVVDSLEVERILRLLDEAGVSGYTVIKGATGKGERGKRDGQGLTDVFDNSYIVTICSERHLPRIVETIRPVLKRFGGVCVVSDALYVMHDDSQT